MKKLIAAIVMAALGVCHAAVPPPTRSTPLTTNQSTGLPAADNVPTWDALNNRWVFQAPPGASGGEANTASSLGSGMPLTAGKVGIDLQFNSITNADGTITISSNSPNRIVISAASGMATDSELSSHASDTTSVHGIADTSALIVANGTATLTSGTLNLPSSNADPSTTAGQLRHDSTVTGLTGGALKWWDGTSVRIVVDLDTAPSNDDYVLAYDAAADKFYMKEDSTGAGGADADAIHDNVAGEIAAIADKATPVAADHLVIEDSAASNDKKDITVGSLETALEGVMDLQDMQGAVTDSQVPDSITVTTAGTANAGDSATAFFSSGQIERARGGTGADTSAYGAGLLGSDGSNNTIDVDSLAELDTAIGLTGTADSTTYLRGDGAWTAVSGSGDSASVNATAISDSFSLTNTPASGTVTPTTFSVTAQADPDPDFVTLTIGNASATQAGAVTTGTQSFAGNKTMTGSLTVNGDLTVDGTMILSGSGGAESASLQVTNKITNMVLVAGGVVIAGADKALSTDTDFTFATDTLYATKLTSTDVRAGLGVFTNTVTIPNSDDPDVSAAGHLAWDTDGWLRAYDGAAQVAVGRKQEEIHATVIAPNDLADAVRDACPIWSNESGMSFVVTGWKAWSGTDDTTLNIEETDGDGQNNATVDAVEIATNGTGVFYGSDTTITAATIENGHMLWLDFDDTDAPTYVKITIYGYYAADVN